MQIFKYLILITVLLLANSSIAQETAISDRSTATPHYSQDELFLLQRVKLLDEFIARFNYEKKIDGSQISETNPCEISRKQMITSLIDYNFYILSPPDSINAFTYYFTKGKRKISFCQPNWYAEVNTKMIYNNKPVDVLILMQIETNERTESKWVFKDAKALFLTARKRMDNEKFIQPLSHELNFSEFRNVFKQPEDIKQYAARDFQIDRLSVFFNLVQNKKLTYEQVNNIQFVFEFPKYSFRVSKLTRPEQNSGWIITNIVSN